MSRPASSISQYGGSISLRTSLTVPLATIRLLFAVCTDGCLTISNRQTVAPAEYLYFLY